MEIVQHVSVREMFLINRQLILLMLLNFISYWVKIYQPTGIVE
jgi:hypothetical protein